MDTKQHTKENRIRRMAKRQGYFIQKSGIRDSKGKEFNKARLCDIETGTIIFGEQGKFNKTIDEIEEYLNNNYNKKD